MPTDEIPDASKNVAGERKRDSDVASSQGPTLPLIGLPVSAGAFARAVVAGRDKIGRYLDPSLFADPAFDILLDLYASEAEGRKVSMTGCSLAARVARTTALRWIRLLEQKGLVERYCDATDHRQTLVRLTDAARPALTEYLEQVARTSVQR